MIDSFLHYIYSAKGYSENTIIAYEKDLYHYKSYILDEWKVSLENVEGYQIESYLSKLSLYKLNSKTIARKLSSIKQFYEYLVRNEIIQSNPSQVIEYSKKDKKLPNFFTLKEVKGFLDFLYNLPESDKFKKRDIAIFEVLAGSGLRVSELVDIKYSKIDLNIKTIRVLGKGNKERIVPLSNSAQRALIDLLGKSRKNTYVFLNKNEKRLTRQGVFFILNKRIKQFGLDKNIYPHKLRHTFASLLIQNGADIRFVQKLLGHKSLASTEVYTHLDIARKKRMYNNFHPHK